MDTGGLAQMTFNSSLNNDRPLGGPGSSFGSRGKGSHITHLNVLQPHTPTIEGFQSAASVSTPRTNRSHLLAGLRTAPKSAVTPSSSLQQHHHGRTNGRRMDSLGQAVGCVPQAANNVEFHYTGSHGINRSMGHPMYTQPEQVLAPPELDAAGDMGVDDNLYAELMSTNLFLAVQQQRLQQQLVNVTAAAHQFQKLSLGTPVKQQLSPLPMDGMGVYQQQLLQGVQPVVQPAPGQPGLFCVYNPLTGQQSFVYDQMTIQEDYSSVYQEMAKSPNPQTPAFYAEVSLPFEPAEPAATLSHPTSPPHSCPSPLHDRTPLLQPSSNAFRRGDMKGASLGASARANIDTARANIAVGAAPKSATFPLTPTAGTFGPGQGRAGEHPARQPRGPPPLEELVAKPTSKHDGSKNFAARQRRRAVHSLVRAGIERRGEHRSFGQRSSGGSNTPASEKEFTFSDGDDATGRSGSLSSRPSLGSLRAVANGAIGSERKGRTSRGAKVQDSSRGIATSTSEDGTFAERFGDVCADYVSSASSSPSAAAVIAAQNAAGVGLERRKTPMFVLSSAERRKTSTV